MNHWLILILSAIAMVAILVVFMWWWTTDNWDWASAELKPPRTVRLSLETAAEFAEQLQILELEQRVTALEKRQTAFEISWDSQLGRDLRLKIVAEVAATPSPATESHIKGDPLGVERDSTTLPTLRFSQSGHPTTGAGLAGNVSGSVEVEDVSK